MSLSLTGRIKVIMSEVIISEKFKKRDFVITDETSQYPQDILFQLVKDRTSDLDKFKEGDVITVHFNLKGREWISPSKEVKYFTTLEAWRLENASETLTTPTPVAGKKGSALKQQTEFAITSDDSDLPF
jgi:hypothetical protein